MNGQDTPSIHYKFRADDAVLTYSFLPDGSVIDITRSMEPSYPQYVLSDSVDLTFPRGTVLNMEVASDKESNYNNFQKRIQEAKLKGASMVMPVFSFKEILSIKPADMDHRVAEFRYDVFGGSARNFKTVTTETTAILPVVEETLTLLFPDLKAQLYDSWMSACIQVSSALIRKTDAITRATVNSMMWHMQPDSTKAWASKFMEWLAATIVDERAADLVDELESIIGKSGVGNLFEAIGHRKLLKSTVPFLLKPLSESMSPTKPAFCKSVFNLPVARLKTVDEIQRLPIATYGLPMSSNFPTLDAIIQPDTLLQFTISPEQHDGKVGQLSKIRAQLRAPKDDHRIIFIIPAKNIETFRYHTHLKDIRQLVCVDDPSVVDEKALLNKKETKAWI